MPEHTIPTDPLPILGELHSELQRAFRAHEHDRRRPAPSRPPVQRKIAVSLVGVAGVAILATLILGARSGPDSDLALALPVLREPASDARAIRTKAQELVQAGADFRDAHRITTPYGTGYVMPAIGGHKLCLAIPDPVDGYGVGCTPTATAKRRGLYSALVGPHGSEFVAVLPANGQDPILHRTDGSTSVLESHGDVAAVVVHKQVTITIRAGAASESITIPGSLECSSTAPRHNDAIRGHFKRGVCRER